MKTIPLTQGKQAIVDDEDYEFLLRWIWHATTCRGMWYAARRGSSPKGQMTFWMHREILGIKESSIEIDHRNRNGLDNRRQNIRVCTRTQNLQNRAGWSRTSQFKGVYWNTRAQRWITQIRVDGRKLGKTHKDEREAALQYDQLARHHFGEFAHLNFPDS